MDHVGPQGVLQEINGSLEISKSHEVSLEVLWVLRGFLMNLKGFSGASRSPLDSQVSLRMLMDRILKES